MKQREKMYRPAGYSSDEDEYADYLSDDGVRNVNNEVTHRNNEITRKEQNDNKLFMAILYGKIDIVTEILDNGCHVNEKLKDDWTPLLLAASVGDPIIAKELIKRGADVNTHKDYFYALMAAAACPESTSSFERSLQVAIKLIENNADVNARTRKRMTALMYAASNGHIELIKILLETCDKTITDNQGWTALFWAVNDNKAEAVKILLDAGLEYDKLDVRGNTPLQIAIQNDFDGIISILPDKYQKKQSFLQDSVYSFEELFTDAKPKFLRDVCLMLYGMKNERNMQVFLENNVDLLKFLTLTDEDLLHLGVNMPYERYRIKCGLYRFHKHLYKHKSIPIISKNAPYSMIDVANTILASCRQFITMEASFKYIMCNINNPEDLRNFRSEIELIKKKIFLIKNTALTIHKKTKVWDLINQPADLITQNSCKNIKIHKFTWLYTIGILSLVSYYAIKKFYIK